MMVLDELKEWLDKTIYNMSGTIETCDLADNIWAESKRHTLRMVREKITELESQFAVEPECNCYICENQRPCFSGNWVITCDKDGKTCDNFIERGSNNG